MIDNIEDVQSRLHSDNLYLEPKFSSLSALPSLAACTSVMGHNIYPYCFKPTSMSQLRGYTAQLNQPVILHSALAIDSLDDAFNVRQNPLLAARYIVQFGTGESELAYAKQMLAHKFKWFLLQDDHGAQQSMVDQVVAFRMVSPDAILMVGNFYTAECIDQFVSQLNMIGAYRVDFWQIVLEPQTCGIGNLGYASLAKVRAAGYPVVALLEQLQLRDLIFALACGAKMVHFKQSSFKEEQGQLWQTLVQEQLLELLRWQGVASLERFYEESLVKWS